jgi:hypothetical protein
MWMAYLQTFGTQPGRAPRPSPAVAAAAAAPPKAAVAVA